MKILAENDFELDELEPLNENIHYPI